MRYYLLPKDAKYYKANLHSHTVLSDGKRTPEENKEAYKKSGYSILAITDHDQYCQHQNLTDKDFVVLNGFELEYYTGRPWGRQKCAHFCFIAKDPDNEAYGFLEKKTIDWLESVKKADPAPVHGGGLYTVNCGTRPYDASYINEDIAKAKEMGFFVTYNHPCWSLERYPDYSQYKGMDAMEIYNHGCYILFGFEEDDSRVYQDFLGDGKYMYCIAADDNHNTRPDDDIQSDSCGGYVQVAAENLDYKSVTKALENGQFYACSRPVPVKGDSPEIRNLWVEDGKVHIETSNAAMIALIKDIRNTHSVVAQEGESVNSADFNIGECNWFRLYVVDRNGRKAYTNAYYPENYR